MKVPIESDMLATVDMPARKLIWTFLQVFKFIHWSGFMCISSEVRIGSFERGTAIIAGATEPLSSDPIW